MIPQKRTAPQGGRWKRRKRSMRAKQAPSPEQSPANYALKVIASIYWDLNCITHLRKSLRRYNSASEQDCEHYDDLDEAACSFVAYFRHLHRQGAAKSADGAMIHGRCVSFIQRIGWRTLSVCAYSEAFRLACCADTAVGTDDEYWRALGKIIAKNERSLEIFSRTRGLDWRAPLLTLGDANGDPSFYRILIPETDLAKEHHHHVVQTLDGRLQRPRYRGKTQVNVNRHVYNTAESTNQFLQTQPASKSPSTGSESSSSASVGDPYPMRRQPGWGNCDVCGKAFDDVCRCRIPAMAGELMELVEYPFKGVGVRALAELRQGEILGEYLGELLPVYAPMKDNDYVFAFEMNVDGNEIPVGFIDPCRYGNWTRFLNHSCNGSTEFKSCIAGPNASNLCSAKRDIALFEEVTIHYGAAYWLTRTCKCGSANCISRVGS